jgi:hypothetical protein
MMLTALAAARPTVPPGPPRGDSHCGTTCSMTPRALRGMGGAAPSPRLKGPDEKTDETRMIGIRRSFARARAGVRPQLSQHIT